MPLPPRRNGASMINVWPGWVDALSSLLMVVIFVLLVFTMAQFFLQFTLTGQDAQLNRLTAQISELATQLDAERSDNQSLELALARLTTRIGAVEGERDAIRSALASRTAQLSDLEDDLIAMQADLENREASNQASLLALDAQEQLTQQARDEVALLNQQIMALREDLAAINALLGEREAEIEEQNVQIINLGERLNQALASEVENLARYRSEFFGRLREILGERDDVRIVGDRFVFQSEVLFASGSDVLEPAGQDQLRQLAETLQTLAAEFPDDLNWILRIDGHTDRIPINTTEFPSNWELSAARAISVLKFLSAQGIPERRLAATGFGEFQPIDPADTIEARKRNRRIELKFDQR